MTWQGILQLFIYLGIVLWLASYLGAYMFKVFNQQETFLDRFLVPAERFIYRICRIDYKSEQNWSAYAMSAIVLGISGIIVCFLILFFQKYFPFNPQKLSSVRFDVAINTAVAFATNTDWQAYQIERTLSYFSIVVVLTVQGFISPGICMSAAVALMRGLTRENSKTIGNFWVDLTRGILWILLPISIIAVPILVWQGVPQNFLPYVKVTTLEGIKQIIAQGPVASFTVPAILGSNGGGIFAVNAAHPYANPTAITNFIYLIFILLIGMSLINLFGRMANDRSQAWVLLIITCAMFVIAVFITYYFESQSNQLFSNASLDQKVNETNIGGNMEGKEVRFGIAGSSLWAAATTSTDNGSTNSAHDSYSPLGGMMVLSDMLLGSLVGGSGAAFYTLIVFTIITVFIVCLMVGTMPEYLGKKIEVYEIKLVMYALLVLPVLVLSLTSIAIIAEGGLKSVTNPGPHGLTQILYNYTSVSTNNGSSFGGLEANNRYHNLIMPIGMILGKFLMLYIIMALAGALAEKKINKKLHGSLHTNTPIFAAILMFVIFTVGGLVYLPALSLGPIAEHIMIINNKMF